jgi:hypothetical protein
MRRGVRVPEAGIRGSLPTPGLNAALFCCSFPLRSLSGVSLRASAGVSSLTALTALEQLTLLCASHLAADDGSPPFNALARLSCLRRALLGSCGRGPAWAAGGGSLIGAHAGRSQVTAYLCPAAWAQLAALEVRGPAWPLADRRDPARCTMLSCSCAACLLQRTVQCGHQTNAWACHAPMPLDRPVARCSHTWRSRRKAGRAPR